MTTITSAALPVPAASVALTVTKVLPIVVGTPLMIPVSVLIVRPSGSGVAP